MNNVPNDIFLNHAVAVNQSMTKGNDFVSVTDALGDVGHTLTKLTHRFADNDELALNCGTQHSVSNKIIFRFAANENLDGATRVVDIRQ